MALSKPMRELLEAVAAGLAWEDRQWSRRSAVVSSTVERAAFFPRIATVQALADRGFIFWDIDSAKSPLRIPYGITDAGRAELAKEANERPG